MEERRVPGQHLVPEQMSSICRSLSKTCCCCRRGEVNKELVMQRVFVVFCCCLLIKGSSCVFTLPLHSIWWVERGGYFFMLWVELFWWAARKRDHFDNAGFIPGLGQGMQGKWWLWPRFSEKRGEPSAAHVPHGLGCLEADSPNVPLQLRSQQHACL